ncbi:hypothetical protein DFH09DRAFT_1101445 [Mycena vulgaris]|nr:hypothetical protein DFH09DRAFT_1101445 [Mycena vulgaris]
MAHPPMKSKYCTEYSATTLARKRKRAELKARPREEQERAAERSRVYQATYREKNQSDLRIWEAQRRLANYQAKYGPEAYTSYDAGFVGGQGGRRPRPITRSPVRTAALQQSAATPHLTSPFANRYSRFFGVLAERRAKHLCHAFGASPMILEPDTYANITVAMASQADRALVMVFNGFLRGWPDSIGPQVVALNSRSQDSDWVRIECTPHMHGAPGDARREWQKSKVTSGRGWPAGVASRRKGQRVMRKERSCTGGQLRPESSTLVTQTNVPSFLATSCADSRLRAGATARDHLRRASQPGRTETARRRAHPGREAWGYRGVGSGSGGTGGAGCAAARFRGFKRADPGEDLVKVLAPGVLNDGGPGPFVDAPLVFGLPCARRR